MVITIGVDPGLAKMAYTVLMSPNYELLKGLSGKSILNRTSFVACRVLSTKPDKALRKKNKVRDYATRITQLTRDLLHVRRCLPAGSTVLWACETFSINPCSQTSAAGMQTLAMYGAVQGLATACGDSFFPVTPAQGKKEILGSTKDGKQRIINLMSAKIQEVSDKKIAAGKMEHATDSAAVGIAGLKLFSDLQ